MTGHGRRLRVPAPPRATGASLALLLVAAAATLAGMPSALAQLPVDACDLQTSVMPATMEHAPGEARLYTFHAEVPGSSLGGDVTLSLGEVTTGWNASLGETAFPLGAGEQRDVQVLVTAPAASDGADTSTAGQALVTIEAVLQCRAAPNAPVVDSFQGAATLTPTVAPPGAGGPGTGGPGSDAQGTGALSPLLWGLGLLALAGLVAAGVWVRTRGRPALSLTTAHPRREVAAGGGASFTLEARNRGPEAIEVDVHVGEPEVTPLGAGGWRVIPPPSELRIEAGGVRTLQVLMRSPAGAKPGDTAQVVVELRPASQGAPRGARQRLEAYVEGRVGTGAEPARLRPRVLVRDEQVMAAEHAA